MHWPHGARKWSTAEIIEDARTAAALFCERRLGEPKDRYLTAFRELENANKELLGSLARLKDVPVDSVWLGGLLAKPALKIALRYLAAPPISEDDLASLCGDSLAPTLVRQNPDRAAAIATVILQVLDPKRFPWMFENRSPTAEEVDRAVLASTVVAAAQRVQTSRRHDERTAVEGAVEALLASAEWVRRPNPKTGIKNIRRDAPGPREFMKGVTLGNDGADFVIGLVDHRLLALECKGSNSGLNSRKRINKEIANDARAWLREFGDGTVVAGAAIQGVFKPSYIEAVQEIPVVFFWSHRLDDLRAFLSPDVIPAH